VRAAERRKEGEAAPVREKPRVERARSVRSARPGGARAGRFVERHLHTLMILPAAITLALIIAFPLVYSLWMAVHEYSMGATTPPAFVGAANYLNLLWNPRFQEAVPRTFYFTLLGVAGPVLIGTVAALAFSRSFPGRGVLRTIFTLPMMATPVSIALIWQMMFHPQLGVLNYLLSLVGIGPQKWVFASQSVIPTLALVETWQWTPFVMLIVLGGLASLPEEPFEAARIDGASFVQSLCYITLPLLWPYIMVAIILRAIDALKSFDIIYVITQGGPGTASETINIFLYLQAFAFYNVGFASAVVVVFFLLILAMSVGLLLVRRRTSWQ
jgi:multiple sugar transport system permease protein